MSVNNNSQIASVQSRGQTWLFYTKRNGTIAYFISQNPKESQRKPYKSRDLEVEGATIQASRSDPVITAVQYTSHEPQIRIYYIDSSERRLLKELCLSGSLGESWYPGSLDHLELSVADTTGLSANVMDNQLKVFYNRKDSHSEFDVAWVTLNEETWSSRGID